MNTETLSRCPFHAADTPAAPPLQPAGAWPPGPRPGLTGWGLLRQMAADPLGMMDEWRRRHGDIVHLRIWPEHQVLVTEPGLVRELLVTHHDALIRWERGVAVFAQLHGNSVLISEGAAWRTKRQALQPSFAPKEAQSLVPLIAAATAKALGQWQARDDAPIEHALTSLGMDVILQVMFSSEIDTDARLAEKAVHDSAVVASNEMYWPASWPAWMPWKRSKREALALLDRLIGRHIDARLALVRAAWPKDVLSRLLAMHIDDPAAWPLKAVRDECMTAFLAGHETSAATLTWWAWCMAANPAAQAEAQREVDAVLGGRTPTAQDLPALSYLTQTLQETMRLYPAAPLLLSRRSIRPIVLGGWQLPARTMFTVPVQLLHHEARWFPEPLAFRPERFAADAPEIPRGAFMPMGTGPRVCLGQHLAMTEMTVIAAMLLQRFGVSVPAEMAAPKPVFNISLRPAQALKLKLTARPNATP